MLSQVNNILAMAPNVGPLLFKEQGKYRQVVSKKLFNHLITEIKEK